MGTFTTSTVRCIRLQLCLTVFHGHVASWAVAVVTACRTPRSLEIDRGGCIVSFAVPVRTVGEQSYRIKEFRLRFFDSGSMFQPSQEVRSRRRRSVAPPTNFACVPFNTTG